MTRTSVYSVIMWVSVTISSSWSQCVTETHEDAEFSINTTEHIEVDSSQCLRIEYKMTFPKDKATVPNKMMLFQGDPSNIIPTEHTRQAHYDREELWLNELPPGEYEYGFKLEWGCNQTYVFPKRVRVSVSASTTKPSLWVPPMVEGQDYTLRCRAACSCSGEVRTHWKWTKADGQSTQLDGYGLPFLSKNCYMWHQKNMHRHKYRYMIRDRQENAHGLSLYPTANHHNTNITCVVEYKHDVVETTVTLSVKFPPKILKDSHCVLKDELLVCVCISWGNPLPPITWPLQTLTDYSITSSSSNQTVSSTITLPAAEYQNTTVKCISSNKLGQDETEILIQNSTEEMRLSNIPDEKAWFEAALPWMTAVCFSLNLVFITILIICVYQRKQIKKKKLCEETNTYASLRKAEVEEVYSVISTHVQ